MMQPFNFNVKSFMLKPDCDVWQVADGIYQHVDVREEGKENAFSLGHTLWINSEVRSFARLFLF